MEEFYRLWSFEICGYFPRADANRDQAKHLNAEMCKFAIYYVRTTFSANSEIVSFWHSPYHVPSEVWIPTTFINLTARKKLMSIGIPAPVILLRTFVTLTYRK